MRTDVPPLLPEWVERELKVKVNTGKVIRTAGTPDQSVQIFLIKNILVFDFLQILCLVNPHKNILF